MKKQVFEIHRIEEDLSKQADQNKTRIDELQVAIKALNKKISDMECPRDDSLDNTTVVWLSTVFGPSAASTPALTEASVPSICRSFENSGLVVRRCEDEEEAIGKSRDLRVSYHLACVILGGTESSDSNASANNDKKVNYLQAVQTLIDAESAYARKFGAMEVARIAVYAFNSLLSEEDRLALWSLGVQIFDDYVKLVAWVTLMTQKDGPNKPSAALAVDADDGLQLDRFRLELDEFEAQKAAAVEGEERQQKSAYELLSEKNRVFVESVDNYVSALTVAESRLTVIHKVTEARTPRTESEKAYSTMQQHYVGTHSARDAALAMAWLDFAGDSHSHSPQDASKTLNYDDIKLVNQHLWSVKNEILFQKRVVLATTVIAHVSSSLHKKLLNLCHHWLTTFLPYCLAKVNRVSYGLLTDDDCKNALALDAHVPRSRLNLAVPFVGKDVPSHSSEFAHPDIIIGATIFAYRHEFIRFITLLL